MNVIIGLDHGFDRTPDGKIWTQTMFAYSFWGRYLDVFDEACVVARCRSVSEVPADWEKANGERVHFAPLPYYHGPWQYLRQSRKIKKAINGALNPGSAVILRVSSQIATCIEAHFHPSGHPFGVEVVGDPFDVFAPGAFKHPLRPFFRWWFSNILKKQCTRACASAYVTEKALQRRYPPAPGSFTTHYSSIELPEIAFVSSPRTFRAALPNVRIITVGSLAHFYKGPDTLIEAAAICVKQGLYLHLVIVGDGKYKGELESKALSLGLGGRIEFTGQLTAGAAVRTRLDQADLFVLPSRQEGVPRAMIEAMARGLPCLGSTIGGIPELLPPTDMVPAGQASALAHKIMEVCRDPLRLHSMSVSNLAKARDYHDDVLKKRRIAFYRYLKERTGAWLTTQKH